MSHMASVPCFDQLRTKEQLGYLVWSFPDNVRGTMSFRVVIQSTVAHPIKLDERIEQFLQDFRKELAATTTETLESNKEGVINDLLEKTKGISQQLAHYWNEFGVINLLLLLYLFNGRYQFDRRSLVANVIARLSLENILSFYDEFILGSKNTLSKLSVQCFSKSNTIPTVTNEEAKKSKIHLVERDKILSFRKECGYNPFPYDIPKDFASTADTLVFQNQNDNSEGFQK
ncbi:hypothetical protein RFI_08104 [Reticulomyxa filosa]|uniref:Coenzyme PQQ synthesis protein F-like C-terminal lobe domain-containing protein n=1 Tax=Reticulomyxa filosa TaxID=46433 RepID=X6NUT1_RETFI|nr:hypothetical protein RFI_08104 [Reticulomyxa filosa]|eukprot:ETO29022.1 hypothetical protein RFI_08104 [Reticulomyxa filosa]